MWGRKGRGRGGRGSGSGRVVGVGGSHVGVEEGGGVMWDS